MLDEDQREAQAVQNLRVLLLRRSGAAEAAAAPPPPGPGNCRPQRGALTSISVSSGRSGASKVTAPSRLTVTGSAKVQQWPGAGASGAASLQAPGAR